MGNARAFGFAEKSGDAGLLAAFIAKIMKAFSGKFELFGDEQGFDVDLGQMLHFVFPYFGNKLPLL